MSRGEAPVVSVVAKEMVVPAQPTRRHSHFLSCFDIFWKGNHYNQRVLFYERSKGGGGLLASGQEDGQAVMEKLKRSLALCLVHYYPWCGRLSPGPPRLCIDCNDAGVEFVEAALDLPMSRLSHHAFQTKPFFQHLCQSVDHSGDSIYSSPLLSIQATLFSDGGLALGITQSHVVADGQALWNFMVSWGECARGLPLSVPPLLERERLAVPFPSPEKATWEFNPKISEEDLNEDHHQQDDDTALTLKNGDSVGTPSLSEDSDGAVQSVNAGTSPSAEARVPCVFNLTSSAINHLKIEDGGVHTSYEVTCAHLWQRLTAAEQRPSHEPTFFFVLANCRSRVKPPLPPAYFGNAISFAMTVSTASKIRTESLNATASRIHDAVMEAVQDSLVGFMHWLEIHDHDLMSELYPKIPKGKGINVASSPRFPVYEVDFGWGKPAAVRSPKVPGEWEMVFFGGHPKSAPGDVEICTNLPSDVLRRLIEDPLFIGKPPCNPFEDS